MAYSSLGDMEKRVPRSEIDKLCKDTARGAGEVVPELVAEADGIIDLYNTQGWTDAQKLGCSRALAIEMLFGRHGTGKVPAAHQKQADEWRDRLRMLKLRGQGSWTRIAHDPALDETDEELDDLLTRDTT